MSRRIRATISCEHADRGRGDYSFNPKEIKNNDGNFSNINLQYLDTKEVINRNVQNRVDLGLVEGINHTYIKNIKNFCKLPCQIEKKMVYLYGCHNWVRKGKPRVIGGRKATGPKDNQVFFIEGWPSYRIPVKLGFFIFR